MRPPIERKKAFGNIVRATPAQEKKDPKPKDKAVKSNNTKSTAAPVLPQAAPKNHDKKKERGRSATKSPRGDDKGKGRSSTPADTSKIGCAFHFFGKKMFVREVTSANLVIRTSTKDQPRNQTNCVIGADPRAKSPGPRSSSPKPMSEQPCWHYQKGKFASLGISARDNIKLLLPPSKKPKVNKAQASCSSVFWPSRV